MLQQQEVGRIVVIGVQVTEKNSTPPLIAFRHSAAPVSKQRQKGSCKRRKKGTAPVLFRVCAGAVSTNPRHFLKGTVCGDSRPNPAWKSTEVVLPSQSKKKTSTVLLNRSWHFCAV